MNRAIRLGTLLFALLALSYPHVASITLAQDRGDEIGRTEVVVPISVFDKKGKWVAGLRRENFRIYEEGVEQTITDFESPSQLPLQVAVLMDTRSSVKRKLKFQQDSAIDFVLSVVAKSNDRALFATFDSNVQLRTDFTRDTGDLNRAILAAKAGGDTKLFDAVYRVCEEKMMLLPGDTRGIIIVITDGADTDSDHTLEQAIEMAQRANVTVFGVSTRNYTDISAGTTKNSVDKELDRLCSDTGGRTFLPYQRLELALAFKDITENLTKQYIIYYEPKNEAKDGKFRRIYVDLVNVDGSADIKAKKGYFAPKPGADVVPR